jgi:hypothetical protein
MPLYNVSFYGSGRYGLGDSGPIYSLPISYYLDLYTSEYKLAPNLNAWTTRLLGPPDDTTQLLALFTASFDLDTAVGVQLDILGQIEGVSRTLNFQPTGGLSPILDDDTYRTLIRAKIGFNQWDGLQGSLQPIWQGLFPQGTIIIHDNQNMTADVIVTGVFTPIIQQLISNGYIVPRPETVQYTYVFGDLPLLGFDLDDAFVAGLDVGHFI